ncbi:L-serine ammonia-lyase [Mycolicibacterium chubuense]|uniref:L-serine dehydratase n=1 Tax=Mycolicibacterium chubuense TaxID=1800 RepID=A0A0J6VTB8_MYCCU|nr:L-serine ammonia-lyase [Mycolicibacterium chubuense]KMO73429.1 L-serine dehydratase 1 [Mycolicibacterium chubuense]ORA56597.1 L-serine ammonia-lyase [Mycolicibacterium chubuense]SPX98963.1 L-serine ammonia-lyase [Mycolicibacterium chubuense]
MAVSVFDLFSIGIGPSSSHTVGPMRAAHRFAERLRGSLDEVARVRVQLFGSLGATGAGHGTPGAVMLGLEGAQPESIDPAAARERVAAIEREGRLLLAGERPVEFDIVMMLQAMAFHSNGMVFHAERADGTEVDRHVYYSVGGGFVVDEDEATTPAAGDVAVPYPFRTAAELVALAEENRCRIADLVVANEEALGNGPRLREGLLHIWATMRECVANGLTAEGTLPGVLHVRRRAAALARALEADPTDPLFAMDWVTVYALAVNEENAAGGRVVTAPTNGAAGIIPAVLHYYWRFVPNADDDGVVEFLLTAAAIGQLFKANASISGAEVGCQGEVGSACSMAAAGLAAVQGGSPAQVENAAEIGIEHNLGLTCDPVGGLVQIPCIERNAVASVKAITAARMALFGDGTHHVSLDTAIKTMRDTGADMADKYKETSRGGLALNVVEC